MIFDRILEDVLGFIRRLLWWREHETESVNKPFQSMRLIPGEFGVISTGGGTRYPQGRAQLDLFAQAVRFECNDARCAQAQ
ncbi:hypothetical protein C7293_25660 [filamentous cyanobacterium CCT1]|nr:hypothetical protein C7293_25660 [filamentous cyanobacterium CCT1]PSN79652.1 hypothetical protein C8B47_10490 [filamentous cyanobacterium CCP4]